MSDFDQIVSPVSVAHFSQYKLSRLLLKHLEKLGFHMINSEKNEHGSIGERKIFMGHECIAINGAEHGVTVTASFLSEGKYITRDIQCHFLVGTDGAGSSVRKSLGINMRGEKDLQKLVSVHFLSKALGQYLIKERPGMLFFIFNKDAIGVLVAHDLKQGEFVLQVNLFWNMLEIGSNTHLLLNINMLTLVNSILIVLVKFLQVPFYPPQQKLEDFSSEVFFFSLHRFFAYTPLIQ